jgi:bacillolysin
MVHLKKILPVAMAIFSTSFLFSQKIIVGNNAQNLIHGANMIRYVDQRQAPDFILLNKTTHLQVSSALPWMHEVLGMTENESLELKRIEKDEIGMIHYVYQHKISGIPVEYSEYRIHTKNDQVVSLNGEFYKNIQLNTDASVHVETAINAAVDYIGAETYRWESVTEERQLQIRTNNPTATYAPQPELVIIAKNGNYKNPDFRLCWKMDIYASKPLSRNWVYVDAQTGEVIWTVERIHDVDAPGTAQTVFSGSRSIVADSFGGHYRLREAGRGNGVETYDMNTGTDYGAAVDFTDTDNNWAVPSPAIDQYALDAHWGAEMTYDYYFTIHSRNSIDDNGLALISYVHYDVGYANAFWDGQEMTYGDGDGGTFNEPLTTIDITGHEITHGLTENTAGLVYQDESGGLNESFSDIFGVTIDNFGRGTTGPLLWRIGEECTAGGNGIRLMSNPSSFGDPDTYDGTGWVNAGGPDNGGVHTNSGVQNYWYYLMCQGGTGSNDNGDAYNITGMGMPNAANITYRSLTVYLGPNAQYADARFYAIEAAEDLFGGCSPQVATTTNAWYAVGVGPVYVATVMADLSSSASSICNAPAVVDFTNLSNNGVSYTWHFGDGTSSAATDPSHTYTSNGTYNVSLAVNGGLCGNDSVYYASLISVNIPAAPTASDETFCQNPSVATLNATGTGTLNWYATPVSTTPLFTGNPYITAPISTTTTFYVSSQTPNGGGHVGPLTNAFGTGGNHNNTSTQYIEFSVLQPITLSTVKVYATGAGTRNILLFDNVGTLLNTIPVSVANGTSNITLNLDLQPGDYRIGGTNMNLYRNNSGASYPYSLAGLVNITGSSAGSDFYYYYYDWVITSHCTSDRTPVTVHIEGPAAGFTYNASGSVVTFTNTSANSSGYFWDFGGGNTSTSANPVFDFGGIGTFPVMLVANNNGCSDTTYTNIVISDAGMENFSFNTDLYPNPFVNYITLSLQLPSSGNELTIDAYNAVGQKVQQIYTGTSVSGQFTYNWNTPENLAPGIYFIKVSYNGKELVKRAVKL